MGKVNNVDEDISDLVEEKIKAKKMDLGGLRRLVSWLRSAQFLFYESDQDYMKRVEEAEAKWVDLCDVARSTSTLKELEAAVSEFNEIYGIKREELPDGIVPHGTPIVTDGVNVVVKRGDSKGVEDYTLIKTDYLGYGCKVEIEERHRTRIFPRGS